VSQGQVRLLLGYRNSGNAGAGSATLHELRLALLVRRHLVPAASDTPESGSRIVILTYVRM